MQAKSALLTLICFLAFYGYLFGQTIIPDNSNVYGVWAMQDSPFIIEGLAKVPSDKKLTIEPGVIVKFQSSSNKNYGEDFNYESVQVGYLRVFGEINAVGTANQPILFLPNQKGFWGGISVENSDKQNIFRHCKIKYANTIFRLYDETFSLNGLSFESSKGKVEYCEITHCRSIGLSLRYSEVKVFNTLINNNRIGVLLYVATSDIKNCIIVNSEELGVLSRYSNSRIVNSIIWKNKKRGIETRNQALIINGKLTNIQQLNPKIKTYIKCCLVQDNSNLLLDEYYLDDNIYGKNPKFLSDKSFHLKPKSPCIGEGVDGENIGLVAE